MISGMRTKPLDRALGALVAFVLATAAASAWAIDLPAVMSLLAQHKSGEARFSEERTVTGLDGPLYASGKLSFAAPDRFARYTLEPRPESIEVEGNHIVMTRGSRTRSLTLDAVPELGALVDAMRGTLNGDAKSLQKHFRVQVSGAAAKWILLLKPLDTRLATEVPSIEIVGSAADIRSIELRLAGGDRSLMLIEPLAPVKAAASR
jgi:outer membrane lipoprotein-sorting protein